MRYNSSCFQKLSCGVALLVRRTAVSACQSEKLIVQTKRTLRQLSLRLGLAGGCQCIIQLALKLLVLWRLVEHHCSGDPLVVFAANRGCVHISRQSLAYFEAISQRQRRTKRERKSVRILPFFVGDLVFDRGADSLAIHYLGRAGNIMAAGTWDDELFLASNWRNRD